MNHYDVVVVGAGLTGLTAAYRCMQANKKVLVLEARDRLGGRTLTVEDTYKGQPSHFDLGAHFIGHERYQAPVWDMVQELGLKTFKQYEGPENVMPTPEKFWAGQGANFQVSKVETSTPDIETYIGTTIPDSLAGQAYIVYLEQLSETVWLTSPEKTPNADGLDAISVWDWVCRTDLPGYGPPIKPEVGTVTTNYGNVPNDFRSLTRMLCRVGFSAEPESISMLWLLFYIKSSGGLQMFQSLRFPVQGAQGYRLVEGAQSIATTLGQRLEANQPNCIQLSQPVDEIILNGANAPLGVTVAGAQICTAGKVVVAMSPKLSDKISYVDASKKPVISRSKIAAAMPNSHMVMTYVTFDTAFWRTDTAHRTGHINGLPMPASINVAEYGLSGDALCTDGPVVWTMDNTSGEGQPALFAFIVGDAARKLTTKAARQAAVLDILSKLFDPVGKLQGHNPVYNELDWNSEQYSMGCPAAHFAPGEFLANQKDVLLAPGNGADAAKTGLYFASTECALLSNGYMSGAIWSGEHIAEKIIEAFGETPVLKADQLPRYIEMRTCIQQIMTAIEQQNPMLEWPALAKDCNFQGPGGSSLPTTPAGKLGYIGEEGTVEFYTRMGFFFSISKVVLDNITIDMKNNTGFAAFTVSGKINSNGRFFKNMPATMIYEFSDPDAGPALIKADRLIMDSHEVDALVAAAPIGGMGNSVEADFAPIVSALEAGLGGSTSVWDKAFEATVLYGPGGTAIPTGPYMGIVGIVELMGYFTISPLATGTTFTSLAADPVNLTLFLGMDITGTTPSTGKPFTSQMTVEVRAKNGSAYKEIEMVRFSLDPTLID